MRLLTDLLLAVALVVVIIINGATSIPTSGSARRSQQSMPLPFDFDRLSSSGYVQVRPGAHMFWWLMTASRYNPSISIFERVPHPERLPTILWLQGGPGGSATGFGNFELIGPLDDDLAVRNSSWIEHANLLFIDSPVGTGFSYVDSDEAYATTNEQIAADLVVTLRHIFSGSHQRSSLYVFSESYGGKMAVTLATHLIRAIEQGQLKLKLKSIALGDPWISPYDSVASWPPYLKAMSLLDEHQFEELTAQVKGRMERMLVEEQWENATREWSHLERVIRQRTFNVNFYNVLKHEDPFDLEMELEEALKFRKRISEKKKVNFIAEQSALSADPELFLYKLGDFYDEKLNELMVNIVAKMLKTRPNTAWGSQIQKVFDKLRGDFMKPVLEELNCLLNDQPDLKVVVYNGQLDLIVNVLGTSKWVEQRLDWPGAAKFRHSAKRSLKTPPKDEDDSGELHGFYKVADNFAFYWILNSGHMVPRDAPTAGLLMLKHILSL